MSPSAYSDSHPLSPVDNLFVWRLICALATSVPSQYGDAPCGNRAEIHSVSPQIVRRLP